jgi:hypothetical protein
MIDGPKRGNAGLGKKKSERPGGGSDSHEGGVRGKKRRRGWLEYGER